MQIRAIVPILLALAAAPLVALEPAKDLTCDDRGHGDRLATFCEIREQTLAAGGHLGIDARQNGGISVKGGERSDVLVRARVETAAPSEQEARDLARQIRIGTAGGQVRAEGPQSDGRHHWSVSYEAFVPHRSQVSLITVNGGIKVADVTGSVEFSAVNGGVKLQGLDGTVHGHTTNGGLQIVLAGSRWNGTGMDVQTTNGGVHLTVPQGYSAHLEVGTTNGGVTMDIPITVQGRLDKVISTNLGSGGATVRAITTNGGVTVGR